MKFEPNTSTNVAREVIESHTKIIEAIAAHDSNAAEAAMREHLDSMNDDPRMAAHDQHA